jgi:DNA polymerase-3 subunit alpha
MKSEEELNEKWLSDYSDVIPYELFCEAKQNTVKLCERAKGVQLDRSLKLPVLPDADDVLKEEIMNGFKSRNLPKTKEYLDRIKEEYSLITRKGFSSYFLIQKKMTDEARRVCREILGWGDGSQACGPGRGSATGALTCYCLGITNVDPVKEGLLFSRFMSEARGGRSICLEFKNIDPLTPSEVFSE